MTTIKAVITDNSGGISRGIDSKPFVEKAYEKIEMVKRNPEQVSVMLALEEDGVHCLVLMVGKIPIARILRADESEIISPLFEKSKQLNEVFDFAEGIDNRKGIDEFDTFHDGVWTLIDALLREWEGKGESPNFYRDEELRDIHNQLASQLASREE